MLQLILFFLCAFGVIYLITESVIFMRIRLWVAMRGPFWEAGIYCAYCVGFWVGCLLQMVLGFRTLPGFDQVVAAGFVVMGVVALLRAAWPSFLPGAHDRERELIEELKSAKRADRTS